MTAQKVLEEKGISARVISMPCIELFESQSAKYKESVLPSKVTKRVAIEAGATMCWYKYVGFEGKVVGIVSPMRRLRSNRCRTALFRD